MIDEADWDTRNCPVCGADGDETETRAVYNCGARYYFDTQQWWASCREATYGMLDMPEGPSAPVHLEDE